MPILAITKTLYASLIGYSLMEDVPAAKNIFACKYSLIFRKTSRRSRLRLSTKTNKENPKARTDNRIEKTALTSRFSFLQETRPGADII